MFGPIPGYPPGSHFEDRRALAEAGVHRPHVAGICGRADEGAESIVLNGGYVDDEDRGDVIVYTGAGGNDPGTKRQVRDQTLARTNLALVTSLRLGLPVRVIRGSHNDVRGPASGYRYDGLYRVANYWEEAGLDGFRIWRFRLERLVDESAPASGRVAETPDLFAPDSAAPRRSTVVSRVVRDTDVTRRAKRLYDFRCQVCNERIETPSGPYAEAAHIRPLGRPHGGPDVLENVLCLCPSHHAAFDLYAFTIDEDGRLIGTEGNLIVHPDHDIDPRHLAYHREQFEAARRGS